MKKILLLIGIIIALTIIVHAETKDRHEVAKKQTSQETPSYETLTLMREIIEIQTRMLKGTESKKSMLRELAQLKDKTDLLILQLNQNRPAQASAPLEGGLPPMRTPQAGTSLVAPPVAMP